MTARHRLAVLAPSVGAVSESFIRRHVEGLLPGDTLAITWNVQGPSTAVVVDARDLRPSLSERVVRRGARTLGVPTRDLEKSLIERRLRADRVEVVLVEYLDLGWRMLDLKRTLGVRYVVHAHGYDVSRLLRDPQWRERYRDLANADAIVTVSEVSRRALIEVGLPGTKIHVVPCGVDIPAQATRDKPMRDVGDVRCLAVGRMVAKKAPILLLDAFRRAAERTPRIKLDYVGDGPLLSAASQYVHALGLGSRVVLHGALPNGQVQQLMAEADIFIQHCVTDPLTGDQEGLPVAMLEAMSHGLPVVTTRHAGIPEAITDTKTGYLVDEGDVEGMARQIVELAEQPSVRSALGRSAHDAVQQRFSWAQERSRLLEILGLDLGRSAPRDRHAEQPRNT